MSKIKNHKGMTLSEVLIAVVIMILATALIVGCLRLGISLFEKQKRASQAQMLLDSLTVSIQDELRYATGISGNEISFTYSSRNRAGEKDCKLINSAAKEGHVVIQKSTGEVDLAPDSMYGDLKAKLNDASWDSEEQVFVVDLIVYYDNDTKPITEKKFAVVPLSPDYNIEFTDSTGGIS